MNFRIIPSAGDTPTKAQQHNSISTIFISTYTIINLYNGYNHHTGLLWQLAYGMDGLWNTGQWMRSRSLPSVGQVEWLAQKAHCTKKKYNGMGPSVGNIKPDTIWSNSKNIQKNIKFFLLFNLIKCLFSLQQWHVFSFLPNLKIASYCFEVNIRKSRRSASRLHATYDAMCLVVTRPQTICKAM